MGRLDIIDSSMKGMILIVYVVIASNMVAVQAMPTDPDANAKGTVNRPVFSIQHYQTGGCCPRGVFKNTEVQPKAGDRRVVGWI